MRERAAPASDATRSWWYLSEAAFVAAATASRPQSRASVPRRAANAAAEADTETDAAEKEEAVRWVAERAPPEAAVAASSALSVAAADAESTETRAATRAWSCPATAAALFAPVAPPPAGSVGTKNDDDDDEGASESRLAWVAADGSSGDSRARVRVDGLPPTEGAAATAAVAAAATATEDAVEEEESRENRRASESATAGFCVCAVTV
jgi:hypothetical protein